MRLEKKCTKCNNTLCIDMFAKNRARHDGVNVYCRPCSNEIARQQYPSKREHFRRIHRTYREQNKEKVKDQERKTGDQWRRANLDKAAIYQQVNRALKRGVITKSKNCEGCFAQLPPHMIHGHHRDYSKPLELYWVCHNCHMLTHRLEREKLRKIAN